MERPSLVDFSLWLKDQADIYDDCYPKVSGRFSSQPGKNKVWFGGSNGVTERQNAFSSNFTSRPKPNNSSCIMGDGEGHKLSSCPKFKALSVQEHLNEVQKYGLCFSCLSPQHWLSNCLNQKQCGVNGCSQSHNALLHNLRNVTSMENTNAASPTNPVVEVAVGSSTEHSNSSHRSSHTSVLLQEVPVGSKRTFREFYIAELLVVTRPNE